MAHTTISRRVKAPTKHVQPGCAAANAITAALMAHSGLPGVEHPLTCEDGLSRVCLHDRCDAARPKTRARHAIGIRPPRDQAARYRRLQAARAQYIWRARSGTDQREGPSRRSLSDKELLAKFKANLRYANVSDAKATELGDGIADIDSLSDVRPLEDTTAGGVA